MKIISLAKPQNELPKAAKFSSVIVGLRLKSLNVKRCCSLVMGAALAGSVLTGCVTLGGF